MGSVSDTALAGLHAECSPSPGRPGSFVVDEFIVTRGGDRILLRRLGWSSAQAGPHAVADILGTMRQVVLPDEDAGDPEEHPWDWLASLAERRGFTTSGDELRRLPYSWSLHFELL